MDGVIRAVVVRGGACFAARAARAVGASRSVKRRPPVGQRIGKTLTPRPTRCIVRGISTFTHIAATTGTGVAAAARMWASVPTHIYKTSATPPADIEIRSLTWRGQQNQTGCQQQGGEFRFLGWAEAVF
ncbi:hypothetical protein AGMMS49960_02330 [Betaproteobacteria bacterium]|nr:hypothetical protein AGMMS49960_02330 [Betaproteobacteria bacterium]GHU18612.1 hypothetical protein AGMMS50243_08950 [Betaproteobacteria bacterium]